MVNGKLVLDQGDYDAYALPGEVLVRRGGYMEGSLTGMA